MLEADLYLTKRAKQGFNVVHAVVLAEYDVSVPNAYGELPLENFDPATSAGVAFTLADGLVKGGPVVLTEDQGRFVVPVPHRDIVLLMRKKG